MGAWNTRAFSSSLKAKGGARDEPLVDRAIGRRQTQCPVGDVHLVQDHRVDPQLLAPDVQGRPAVNLMNDVALSCSDGEFQAHGLGAVRQLRHRDQALDHDGRRTLGGHMVTRELVRADQLAPGLAGGCPVDCVVARLRQPVEDGLCIAAAQGVVVEQRAERPLRRWAELLCEGVPRSEGVRHNVLDRGHATGHPCQHRHAEEACLLHGLAGDGDTLTRAADHRRTGSSAQLIEDLLLVVGHAGVGDDQLRRTLKGGDRRSPCLLNGIGCAGVGAEADTGSGAGCHGRRIALLRRTGPPPDGARVLSARAHQVHPASRGVALLPFVRATRYGLCG